MKFCSFFLFLYAVTSSHGSTSAVSTTPLLSSTPSSSSPSPTSSVSPSSSESSSVPSSSSPEPSPSSSSTFYPHSSPAPPPPTPYPNYVVYKLKDGNTTCFLLKGSIEFVITYTLKSTKKEKKHHVILPSNATSSGMCADLPNNEAESFLELKFKAFAFKWIFKVEKDYSWKSHNMSLSGSFSDGKEKIPVDAELRKAANDKMFAASSNHSYSCDRAENVQLSDSVTVIFHRIHVQPYDLTDDKFDKAQTCPEHKKSKSSSDVVPIAVGCALAGLILIVLIAYLIGRRKTSNRGYEQV